MPFSVLDLSPIVEGASAADALRNSLELARCAETLDYRRFWLAEHHNMPGIASAATAVVIGHVAAGTRSIRVGSGGVMLPNHAPLVIAEQFGTLASLFPGRIDLGLGRAPGTDPVTAHALRRDLAGGADQFPQDVQELQSYFEAPAGQATRAIPGAGLKVPIWLLGSSLFSAQLAAALGLPFAFAAHFAPELLLPALTAYRQRFQASRALERPYAMVCVNVIAADTDAEARRLFTSHQQAFTQLRRGRPGQLPAPIDDIESFWTSGEKAMLEQAMRCSFVGSGTTVEHDLRAFLNQVRVEELMVNVHVYDQVARRHSLTLTAAVRDRLAATAGAVSGA
ncbi:MAG TPA: LLM class flavin-dependent oxidoreductase [Steroidobacteraceae bacterium]|nr:LLM class flavin-dependent oxidoreductase [Steroidobacteraceae bacterium]